MTDLLEFYPPSAFDAEGRELPEHTWVEPKLDGVRAIVHVINGEVIITSRRRNKEGIYNRLQDTVPHLKSYDFLLNRPGYSIFDGELVAPKRESNSFGSTMSIVGSNPDKAIAIQQEHGLLELHLFDMPYYGSWDLRDRPLKDRRKLLEHVVGNRQTDQFKLVPVREGIMGLHRETEFAMAILDGYEGIVIKDPMSTYDQRGAWGKIKASATVDAQIVGFKGGNGKYTDTLGALTVAVLVDGSLVEIANVAPGTDFERDRLFAILNGRSREDIISQGLIVELEGQGWTSHNRIRHPRVLRYRTDRNQPNEVDFATVKRV